MRGRVAGSSVGTLFIVSIEVLCLRALVKTLNKNANKDKKTTRVHETVKKTSFKQRLVVAFVCFHILAISIFAIPIDFLPLRSLRNLLAPYIVCIGMTESWDMFAPDPKATDQFLKAIVFRASGQTEVYSFPRMEELSLWERYRKERYRKFTESLLCNECSGLWPDVEKAVARRENKPADPPIKVVLIKFESPIDPKAGSVGDDAVAQPTVLSEFFIQPEDLR